MKNNIEIMMNDTSFKKEVIGEKLKSSFWYGYRQGFYSVQIYFNNFKGRIGIQATLEINPSEKDWFPIYLNSTKPFLEFPKLGVNEGQKETETYNFSGNFVWLRAVMDRKNFSFDITSENISQFGSINKILLVKI
ncbi:MAG: hypothetical protein QXG00_05795 [Candidatus Woesearchaeota archaeon]